MIRVNFNLRKTTGKNPVPIVLRLRWYGNDLKYSTGVNVSPQYFDRKRQRIRHTNAEPMHGVLNEVLSTLQRQAKEAYLKSKANGKEPTKKELKELLDYETGRKRKEILDFWDYFKKYIESSESRINPNTGRKISYRTIQRYRTTFKILVEYEKESRNKLTFENLNVETLTDFIQWLTFDKEYKKNTVAKHWETLKAVLISATNEKQPVNMDYRNPAIKAGRNRPDTVYLTESELQKISSLDLSGNKRLDRVKDMFLIACYTGLRFSDFTNIKPHNISKDFIKITQTKTGNPVHIPIHETVKRIFDKYKNGVHFKSISNQKFNEYIKEVCKQAGLVQTVETNSIKAGKRVTETAPKYKLISSHTGRRTLATNLYKKGIPIQTIMLITGHKTEQSFRGYIRLSNMEHANLIKNVWNEQ